ncbi:hypothetical protein GWO43_16050 [candidate division KSB1 bacterium]|nr:hypothetical protein [candidate division KSB1 bacterium]NIV68746.1 hypothetical protein [Phycisphaerae bacterium]NIS25464.1 hypothetical protein [candidate division KSB1 bacterium]NIT72356.1 hypothetical protein [candidate division KSB1 bacterium]NIU26141.1 hypothetical protein [candidate division KSB1 bacterium]
MADGVMNIAKGRIVEFYNRVESNDPTNSAFIVVLLKAAEADATLEDYDDLSALLGAAGNTEADFTNYARKTITDAELAALPAPDDTNNRYDVDAPDQTWTSAGNGTNNTLVKALMCYDSDTGAGTDANIIPLCHYDVSATTDGSDLTLSFNSAGFFRAA